MNETFYDDGKLGSIRNPDGHWINTSVFREPALHFKKHKYYCADPWDSPSWYEYWMEQRKRCIDGYTVGGVTITGEHYFYLNFCPIQKVEDTNAQKSRKIEGFPDFWDGDFNFFWSREIARNGIYHPHLVDSDEDFTIELGEELFKGLHLEVKIPSSTEIILDNQKIVKNNFLGGFNMITGKARRRGYSYKSAGIASRVYFTRPNSLVIFGAYEKKFLYPKGLFTMARNNIGFINEQTAWAMPSDYVDKQDHVRASYTQWRGGLKLEKGFKSEIIASTFKDNPDAARGKDAEEIFFEESGAFGVPGLLKQSYAASQDCVMAGSIKTGMITLYGTSGDLGSGTADYADMHSRPEAFGLMPFNNIWDKGMDDTKCGFFHPINWNMEGFYDSEGNSDHEGAKQLELVSRESLIKNGATSSEIQKRLQEKPLGPSEAFASVSSNNFPVVELKAQLNLVKSKQLDTKKGTPVELRREGGEIKAKRLISGKVTLVNSLYSLPTDKRGHIVVYESPVPDAPKGLYKIGYDPVRQDQGTSLAGIIVYKGVHRNSLYHSIIVATYIGRKEDPEDMDRIAELLCEYYNTQVMHENEVTGVKNYFRRIKRLDLLAAQPDAVISKNIKNTKVARVYGCHMNKQLKDAGERYIKSWLLTVLSFDEHGKPVTVIDTIYSVRLLEELIGYNRDGNFDLVSALIMCMIQVQEESLGKEYDTKEVNKTAKRLLERISTTYVKN